jgi:predicted acyl esterase
MMRWIITSFHRSEVSPVAGLICILLAAALLCPWRVVAQGVWTETTIAMSDGVALDARIVKPLGFPPSGGFPGVVMVHGYGGNKDQMQSVQVAIALYGYASLAYSVRGQGGSGGVSTTSGDREREDLLAVIQYFRSTSDINPEKLGVAGGSQGGIHSWMAAVYRMPGVKVVAPIVATPDFALALVPRGCVTVGLPLELTVSTVRYSDERDRVKSFIITDQYDSLLLAITSHDLEHLVGNVQIPVLQCIGWGDVLFPVNGGIRAAANLAGRGVPVWSYYGTNGHGQPVNPEDATLAIDKLVAWFDHWLKGFSLENDSIPMVFYSDDQMTDPERSTSIWPPPTALKKRWYITAAGLSETAPTNDSPAALPFTLGYDTAYTAEMGWNDRYGGTRFYQAFPRTSVGLVSEPFGVREEITGIPTGQIYVESDAARFQVHVRFYDVAPDGAGGTWTLISRSINGVRSNSPGETHGLAIEGTALSHFIPAGNRLGVEITSLDMMYDSSAYTIPYFLPSSSFLLTSSSAPSFIQFGDVPTSVEPRVSDIPSRFGLEQNFPNPFNPSTVIRYHIAAAGRVSLLVYDLLGREVARLVDEVKLAGEYEARFDGRGLASGVYLCRLRAGKNVRSRSMVLLR